MRLPEQAVDTSTTPAADRPSRFPPIVAFEPGWPFTRVYGAGHVAPAGAGDGGEPVHGSPPSERCEPLESRLPTVQSRGLMVPVRASGVPSGNVMRE